MKFNIFILMINALIFLSILNVHNSKFIDLKNSLKYNTFNNQLRTKMVAVISASFLFNISPTFAEELSLQEQIQNLQVQQLTIQKERFQSDEQELLTKELQYPEGKLIGRGSIALGSSNSKVNPYGYLKATDIDQSYDSEDASLFILAVGREGPPLAAKKYHLNQLQFPFVFEITSDDLIFPYTQDAWLKSSNSKDTIAITAIVSSSKNLGEPSNTEKFGFGLSEPVVFAGVLSRSPAKVIIQDKIDKNLYSSEELNLLTNVDKELAAKDNIGVLNANNVVKSSKI